MGQLRERMQADLQLAGYSANTSKIYLLYAKLYAEHFMRPPGEMGEKEIRTYLLYLIKERKASRATVRQVRAALTFLYSVTLRRPVEVGALEGALGMIAINELGAKRQRGALAVDAVLQTTFPELQEAPLNEAERKTELVERRRAPGVVDRLLRHEQAGQLPRRERPGCDPRLCEHGDENQRRDGHGDPSQFR